MSLRLQLVARATSSADAESSILDERAAGFPESEPSAEGEGGARSASASTSTSHAAATSTVKSVAELDAAQALLGVSPNTVVARYAPCSSSSAKHGVLHGFTITTTPSTMVESDSRAETLAAAPTAGYASSSIPSWARGTAITQAQPLRFVTAPFLKRAHDDGSSNSNSSSVNASAVGPLNLSLAEAPPSHDDRMEEDAKTRPESQSQPSVLLDAPVVTRRGRSDSVGLDALAEAVEVATTEDSDVMGQHRALPDGSSSSTSNLVSSGHATSASGSSAATASEEDSSDDSEMMPPPPPRTMQQHQQQVPSQVRRPRSVSNPEGMMSSNGHFRLVLPEDVLEEELARVSAAMKRRRRNYWGSDATKARSAPPGAIPEEGEDDMYDDHEEEDIEADGDDEREMDDDNDNDSESRKKLDSAELLRMARARLFEDLMLEGKTGGGSVEKGLMALPHSFEKYKEIYNKDGRVGIYTPTERAAIIERFLHKRSRRVWNKKIRYDCRKNLADRRLRVKGRFVKRSEQEQLERNHEHAMDSDDVNNRQSAADLAVPENDECMPDVNDPEAGFAPTEDLPYRRLRRHTVT